MNAGSYVGRIGGLAVALGVGAAVFAGQGAAYADTGSTSGATGAAGGSEGSRTAGGGASDKSTAKETAKDTPKVASNADDGAKGPDKAESGKGTGKKDRKNVWADLFGGHKPKPDTTAGQPSDPAVTPSDDAQETPAAGDSDDAVKNPPKKPRWSWKPADAGSVTHDTADADTNDDVVAPSKSTKPAKGLKGLLSTITVDVPEAATTPAVPKTLVNVSTAKTTSATTVAEVASEADEASTTTVAQGPLATLFKRFLDVFSGNAPAAPNANSPFAWLVAAASRREVGAQAEDDPTMVWNGYKVVPVGQPTITQFYGKYTMVPAFPGIVQGTQDFDLVDESGSSVATLHSLVTYNNDLGSGTRLVQFLVTDVEFHDDSVQYGTGFKDIPRPGSVFASVSNGRSGNVYSALDNGAGEDVVTYKFVSRNFSIPLNADPFRIKFSSAHFLYDNVGVNRPIDTQDGYYIKPVSPTTPWTGFVGYQPLFNAIQGANTFGVYDEDDNLVGTFEGVVTVTSDFWGTTSEAILVTKAMGDNVGVAAGQVPPEGTIYNIIYWTADPGDYLLYYAKPDPRPNSNVIRTVLVDTPKSGKQRTLDLNFRFDAAAPPFRASYDVPGRNGTGYSFKPVSDIVYSGVNGLPPREAIVQGYQQFEVYDSNGEYLGKVNADVSTQWNLVGNSTQAILVTEVVEGDFGPEAGKVPPVGSVFNWNYTGNSGFGEAYYALANGSDRSKISYQLLTPFGGIPMFINYDAAKGLAGYQYENPFSSAQSFNVLSSASAGEFGGVLGADQDLCLLDSSTCELDAA